MITFKYKCKSEKLTAQDENFKTFKKKIRTQNENFQNKFFMSYSYNTSIRRIGHCLTNKGNGIFI